MPDGVPFERAGTRSVAQQIAIGLRPGAEAGVKVGRRVGHGQYAHVCGKLSVQAAAQDFGVVRAGHRCARDLSERVDAGVGAAGAVHGDRTTLESREHRLEQSLDRVASRLPLPTDEARAVIRNGEF